MASDTPQRSYRAPCPGCGAPVEFRSAQSTHAVCSYCHSTLVRDGDTLQRLGRMSELFDDHSPLQLQARGQWNGRAFTLVGRIQYRSRSGPWTEWNALFDDGATGWLAEDNGAHVFVLPATLGRTLPPPAAWRVGKTTAVQGRWFTITAQDEASVVSAEGELPKLPPLDQPFAMAEMRSAEGEVLSVEWGSEPPQVYRGQAVRLEDLRLSGLKAEVAREAKARQFACPHCGSPVVVKLKSSRSIACPACHALIDLDQGVGGELRHALQDEPVRPLIALGRTGWFEGCSWQVVGFQRRVGWEVGDSDERFGWSEYLLYHRERGFLFLVDAADGWSLYKTVSGAPALARDEASARYQDTKYVLQDRYLAETDYVAGEFYWPVARGQRTSNMEFSSGRSLLSLERKRQELTWSAGHAIASATVAKAFGMDANQELFARSDAGMGSLVRPGNDWGVVLLVVAFVLLVVAVMLANRYGGFGGSGSSGGWSESDDSRSRSGSWGGYSSGGGHK